VKPPGTNHIVIASTDRSLRGRPAQAPVDTHGQNTGNRRVCVRRRLLWATGATVGNRGYNVGNWGYCMGNKIHMVASVALIDWGT